MAYGKALNARFVGSPMDRAREAGVLARMRFDPSNPDASLRAVVVPERGIRNRYFQMAERVGAAAYMSAEAARKGREARDKAAKLATQPTVTLELPNFPDEIDTEMEQLVLEESQPAES